MPRKVEQRLSYSAPDTDALSRGNASGRATRETIILTAERLFSERGIEAVSLREIGMACGQRNNYATQYHFGSRDGLIGAIYEYRARGLNEERLEALSKLEANGELGDPIVLLRALIEPHARHVGDPEWHFLGFLVQLQASRGELSYFEVERPDYMSGFDLIQSHLRRCFPHLSDATFAQRSQLTFGWVIQAMASYERTGAAYGPYAVDIGRFLDEVLAMIVGALNAPPAPGTGRQPKAQQGRKARGSRRPTAR